jgi:hypothetical protein
VAIALRNYADANPGAFELVAVRASDKAHREPKVYDRMRDEAPELLAKNANHWFHVKPEPRLVRTMDGKVRAFLSDRYARSLENSDICEAILPVIADLGIEIISCQITETRIYVKAVDKRIAKDVPVGRKIGDGSHEFFDTFSPALIFSNSEVGSGAFSVETGIWTRMCTNLAIAAERSVRKFHLGGKREMGEQIYSMLSQKTLRMTDAAFLHQVRDVVRNAFDATRFEAYVLEVGKTSENKIMGDPVKTVELAAKQFGIMDGERVSVLKHLIEGGDLSQYGLFNAVTRTAEDLESYDRATEFERLGGKIIELPKSDWQLMAEAA